MAILTYDLKVVGENDVARALATVERRFVAHAAKINRTLAVGGGSMRARAASNPSTAGQAIVRQNTSILKSFDDGQRKIYESTKRYEVASHRQSLRNIEDRKKEQIRAIRDVNTAYVREQKTASRQFRQAAFGGVSKGIGTLSAVGKAGLTTLGVGGSVVAGAAVTEALKLDEMARRTAIQGRAAGTAGMDPEELRKRYVKTAIATGLMPEQVGAGVGKYVDYTGDLPGGLRHMKTWATISQASGTPTADLASATAALKAGDITSESDVSSILSTLYSQGKKGSFKLSDQAQYLPQLIGRGKDFGAHGLGGIKSLGGLLQMTQDVTHDPAETATSIRDMFSELTVKSSKMASGEAFSGRKVNVYEGGDAKKGGRDIRDVVGDVLTASRGNSSQIEEAFGKRAMPAMQGMLNVFKETRLGALKGGDTEVVATKKGHDAALKLWDEAANVTGTYADAQKDAADTMKSTSIQLDVAMTELKQVFAEELMPVVRDLVPHVKDLGPIFRTVTQEGLGLVKFFADHPAEGVGAVLAGSIATELAKAQLSQLVTTGIVTPLGIAGLAVTAFGGALAAAKLWVDEQFSKGKARAEEAAKSGDTVREKAEAEMSATGRISPETRKQLEALKNTEASTLAGADAVGKEGYGDIAARGWQQIVGGKHNLTESATLSATGANDKYIEGTIQTKRLLAADDVAKTLSAKDAKEVFGGAVSDLKDAAAAIKSAAGSPPPNRGNSPSPVKS